MEEKNELNVEVKYLDKKTKMLYLVLMFINIVLILFPLISVVAVIFDLVLMIYFIIKNIYISGKKEDSSYNVKKFNNSFNLRTSFLLCIFAVISMYFDFGCMCTSAVLNGLTSSYIFFIFIPLMYLFFKRVHKMNGDYKKMNKLFFSYILTLIVVGIGMFYIADILKAHAHRPLL